MNKINEIIKNYLNCKEKKEYTFLDKIFELYLIGDISKLLSKYTEVAIYPIFTKSSKSIQFNYCYKNIHVILDFFEDKYNAVVYHAGISKDNLNDIFVDYAYQTDFDLEKLIHEVDKKIRHHFKLENTTSKEKKKKVYSLIAWISLYLPIFICGAIGLYCIITGNSVKGNVYWIIFFIVIPLIIWFIFDVKSKR